MIAYPTCSVCKDDSKSTINVNIQQLPVSCWSEEQSGCGAGASATLVPNVGPLRPGRATEGLPVDSLEPPAASTGSHSSWWFQQRPRATACS